MVITFVIDQYDEASNGTTITAKRMAQGLRERGHTVRILTANPSSEEGVISTGKRYVPILYEVSKSQGMCFAKANKETMHEVFKDSDIVHFLLPFKLAKVGKQVADSLGVPSTAAFHLQPENITSTIYLNWSKTINRYIYKKFRKFYNQFDHVHCPSQMIARELKKHDYRSNLHIISNGVSPRFISNPQPKPEELKDKFVILMIGRLSREKRQDLIIKAVLSSKYEKDIQIIFAGKGPWRKRLLKLGRQLSNPLIHHFYSQDELLKIINYSDLYVHASDAEIEAISCIEAFSCGLVPIISNSQSSATNQFALTDLNLFQSGNPLDLRARIDHFIENETQKNKLSLQYMAYAKQFALTSSVERMEAMFHQAIADATNQS